VAMRVCRTPTISDGSIRLPSGGFSLIELLVVLAVVGILTTIALPSYSHYRVRAIQNQAVVALEMLATRQARYRLVNGYFGEADAINAQALVSADLRQHYDLAVDLIDEGRGYEMRLSPKSVHRNTPILRIDHTGWRDPVGAWQR
jgi:type IV pilus assembly protein PilE